MERLIALLTPHDCLVCGAEGSLLCQWCQSESLPPLPERCYRCQAMSSDSAVCKKCRATTPLRHVWVRTQYDAAAKQLVHALKFQRAKAGAQSIAEALSDIELYLPPGSVVVSVPTATSRVRLRGYDQAALIAQWYARLHQLHYVACLVHIGQSRQLGATAAQRRQQAQEVFRTRKEASIAGKDILLIDDVLTTGATIEAAAQRLKHAGAQSVRALVFAQKQ